MKWRGRKQSSNIEDRRRSSAGKAGGLGIVGILGVLALSYFTGIDMTGLIGQGGGNSTQISTGGELSAEDKAMGEFVSVTLQDTETIWGAILPKQAQQRYNPAKLVLFKGVTASPCGNASGATGPFYCPADRKVYLDTDFFRVLENKMGAKGDFAAAYVVAHEVAHHVQNELNILPQANRMRQSVSQAESNKISVMIELQADCFSGIWARYAEQSLGTLDAGDLEEALIAARQIGDDLLQRNAGRRPMPHTYTHGTSEQRQRWFAIGYQTTDIQQCNTFNARQL